MLQQAFSSPPTMEEKKMMWNLKDVATKAWALHKDGVFTDLKMTVRGAERTNRPTATLRPADGDKWRTTYEWYDNTPVGSRATKRPWHRQMSMIRAEGGEAPRSKADRARVMREWCRRFGVSFRKPNRHFTLSREGIGKGVVTFWGNMERVRLGPGVGGEAHVCNFDQTPARYYSLEGESAIAEKGAKILAVGSKKWGARTACAAVLYLSGSTSLARRRRTRRPRQFAESGSRRRRRKM